MYSDFVDEWATSSCLSGAHTFVRFIYRTRIPLLNALRLDLPRHLSPCSMLTPLDLFCHTFGRGFVLCCEMDILIWEQLRDLALGCADASSIRPQSMKSLDASCQRRILIYPPLFGNLWYRPFPIPLSVLTGQRLQCTLLILKYILACLFRPVDSELYLDCWPGFRHMTAFRFFWPTCWKLIDKSAESFNFFFL